MTAAMYYLTAQDACEAVGITRRQLDYWIERGWFTPADRRRYRQADVDALRALADLSAHGKVALAAEVLRMRAQLVEETARRLAAEDELARHGVAEVQHWPAHILEVYRALERERLDGTERPGTE